MRIISSGSIEGPAYGAVERRQLPPQPVEFDKPVDQSQQVPFRHMPFQRKFVEQRVLMDLPLPHHQLPPSRRDLRLYRVGDAVFQQYRAGPVALE
jgi:hypothetical protein